MAFWKKSEDPWDMDPAKKRRQSAWQEADAPAQNHPEEAAGGRPEDQQGFADTVKSLFKKRKTQEEAPIPAEKCPWCGKDMEWGCITGGRDGVSWRNWKPRGLDFWRPEDWKQIDLLDEGEWQHYKTVWYCVPCGKMVLDAPEQPQRAYRWEDEQKEEIGDGYGIAPNAYETYKEQIAQWNSEKET